MIVNFGFILGVLAGTVYALVGVTVARKLETPINAIMLKEGYSPAIGVYISFMITLLWPAFMVLATFTIAYATLKS